MQKAGLAHVIVAAKKVIVRGMDHIGGWDGNIGIARNIHARRIINLIIRAGRYGKAGDIALAMIENRVDIGRENRLGLFIALFYQGHSWRYHVFASQVMRQLLGRLILLQPTSGQDAKKQAYVERATSYMAQHLEAALTLDELAHAVHLSRPHFVHIFKEVTGATPIDYYTRLKIQRACQYLDLTDLSIKEVARNVGIHDPYYFSRLFRKMMKQSPSDYRNVKKG